MGSIYMGCVGVFLVCYVEIVRSVIYDERFPILLCLVDIHGFYSVCVLLYLLIYEYVLVFASSKLCYCMLGKCLR